MAHRQRRSISITLTPMQVEEVMRAAAGGRTPGVSALIAGSLQEPNERSAAASAEARIRVPDPDDRGLSRSLVRGLSLLACFAADDEERGIVELARGLDMSPSTAHRYVATLVELGLLERCPRTRKYRLPAG
jgi:hypothetical protein